MVYICFIACSSFIIVIQCTFIVLQRKIVQDNALYIRDVIIARGLELYQSVTGQKFAKLTALKDQIAFDPVTPSKPKPAPRTSVQKYSTTEYL